jgi:DNA replication and repair protein RecF
LFAPEDLALVRGEPGGRRRFLDELLVLRTPRMAGVLADYERVVKQRNALLKSARASGLRGERLSTLDLWDDRLVLFGSEIVAARSRLVADLQPEVRAAYRDVAGDDHRVRLAGRLSILGQSPSSEPDPAGSDDPGSDPHSEPVSMDVATEAFRASIERMRPTELDRAITLVGPHRDDLFLELNGLPARGYASHGESWSFALSLKLASAGLLRRESPLGDPVMILDDVFAELDRGRRARLAGAVADFAQVLITAAVLEDVPDELAANTVTIDSGRIVGA